MDPLLVPAAPYARRGHHFTNGPTWVELFARSRGLSRSTEPAYRAATPFATNFAVAAARAYDDGRNVNLAMQVDAFLEQVEGVASPDALHVIEIGGNDIRDALLAYPSGHGAVLGRALSAIAVSIGRLHDAGARHFLVWTAPNLALTPAIRRLDALSPGAAVVATSLATAFNGGLARRLDQQAVAPGITIARFDAFALLGEIYSDGSRFGLVDVMTACVTPGIAPFTCGNPDEYLFWDGIHPTAAVHAIIAQRAAAILGQ
jgi:phospholipase/lecithinase/hemolysin